MSDKTLSLSGEFASSDESLWLDAVAKALKGGGPDRLTRMTGDGLAIKPLYCEADWPSATDPLGTPGTAPFLRSGATERDAHLPWDIRQSFSYPDPATTNTEILRDLERGVSSVEIVIDPAGETGCAISSAADIAAALTGVDAHIAPVALNPSGALAGFGLEAAHLLASWAGDRNDPATQTLAFNLSPLAAFARLGTLEQSLGSAFARTARFISDDATRFPEANLLRVDARMVHEAGGTEAQELAALIAQGIDTLRRLDQAGLKSADLAPRIVFSLSAGSNYGVEIAKLRAARRLWARCLDALGIPAHPMQVQSISSRRMLTARDPWVNILRNSAACFAAGVGGADIVTLGTFTDAIGTPAELGRRIARNTQLIAQEESGLGRIADPAGGAWFMETHADALADAAWTGFQQIEAEGGFGKSLESDHLQARVATARKTLLKDVARRKIPITGVSEFALLEEVAAPVADISSFARSASVDPLPADGQSTPESESFASPLWPIRLSESFEALRDHADRRLAQTGKRPIIFLATLGPLAEYTARADFARNLFAAGGIEAQSAPIPPENSTDLTSAFRASGAHLAVLCGSDARYKEDAEDAARALKDAGAQRLYLAGKPGDAAAKLAAAGIDSYIHIGVDAIATLELAHAELGIST